MTRFRRFKVFCPDGVGAGSQVHVPEVPAVDTPDSRASSARWMRVHSGSACGGGCVVVVRVRERVERGVSARLAVSWCVWRDGITILTSIK